MKHFIHSPFVIKHRFELDIKLKNRWVTHYGTWVLSPVNNKVYELLIEKSRYDSESKTFIDLHINTQKALLRELKKTNPNIKIEIK